jgi:hypothetical protein
MAEDNKDESSDARYIHFIAKNYIGIAIIARYLSAEKLLSILFHSTSDGSYFTFGWGFDEQFPLRYKPVYWLDKKESGVYRSITWIGFFIGLKLSR